MAESLRILILEDNPADAELVQFELQEAGLSFTSKVVMTEKDFVRELQEYCPDLILSDYDLPKYNGALALAEARRRCPDTPFILVTGAVSEDRAIEILTQGSQGLRPEDPTPATAGARRPESSCGSRGTPSAKAGGG